MSYEILDHPVDVKFRTSGTTIEEAFAEVIKCIAEIVGGEKGSQSHRMDVTAESLEGLLFDFLSRIILLQDVESVVVSQAEDLTIESKGDEYSLSALISVDPIESDESVFDIKAPTYSEMRIESNDSWVLEAVLDI